MSLLRDFGEIFRGESTMPQVVLACVLGATLGFVPGFFLPEDVGGGFLQAPGLIITLFALALIFNTNFGLFGVMAGLAKLASIPLLPVSFAVGRYLLEGPTEGLFRWVVQAPVLAWFGFQYYATTGGVALGVLVGVATGVSMWMALASVRTRLAAAETGSERFRTVTSKWYVRFLGWFFLGSGKGKEHTWKDLAERGRKGMPIRWAGVVAALVLVGLAFAVHGVLGSEWFKRQARDGLTRWNGATVDLAETGLDLLGGALRLGGLAMADADRLTVDLFRARTLDLDLSTSDLLAGRIVVDELVSSDAASGVGRDRPGERWRGGGTEPPPPEPPPVEGGDGRSLEDYVAEAQVWKQRLETAARWLEKFSGEDEEEIRPDESAAERDARVARETELRGLVGAVAQHLLAAVPAVTIRELRLDSVVAADLDGDVVDIRGSNVSSHPTRGTEPMSLSIAARSGRFAFAFGFDPRSGGKPTVDLTIRDLPVDAVARSLKALPLAGGTLDLTLRGSVDTAHAGGTWIDLPLEVAMKGTSLVLDGQRTPLDELRMPIGLKGPLAAPSVAVDTAAFTDALVAQGRVELANRVRAEAAKWLPGQIGEFGDAAGALIDGTKSAEQLAEEAKRRAAEEAEKLRQEALRRAEEEAKKALPEALRGLLPGRKKDG